MKNWKELTNFQKLVITLAIVILALLAPEFMMLLDLGGIEAAFTCLLLYYKPLFQWLRIKKEKLINELKIIKLYLQGCALSETRVLISSVFYGSLFILITGSGFIALSFFLPSLFIGVA
ncbi:hypothetical protein [Aliikangiella sp. G2MR2-5]|uniref:hypothetical protein n=1 Tax=Aliikangiella sp. G2MR2-5 TaxID=2788943 RepID=UPI0018AB5839|nr:hypothetical protein [Aliikangiella sp. G2MR2-5]